MNASRSKSRAKREKAANPWRSLPRLATLFDETSPQTFFKGSKTQLDELTLTETQPGVLFYTHISDQYTPFLREHGIAFPDSLLTHISPIGWEHINLTGDYTWHPNRRISQGRFRPLRPLGVPISVHGASS